MSAAPRFSTADIAKGAQAPAEAREAEAAAVEREQALQREQELQREQADERNRAVERMRDNERASETVIPLPAATPVPNAVASNTVPGTPSDANETAAPLFAHDAADDFRRRWDTIQASFVDDPKRAVQEADSLVAETMQRLADSFAQERSRLEQQFDRGSNVSTEDLRMTLRHYRSFFTRLLAV